MGFVIKCGEKIRNYFTIFAIILNGGWHVSVYCMDLDLTKPLTQVQNEDNFNMLTNEKQELVQVKFVTTPRSKRDLHNNDYHILEIRRSAYLSSTMTIHVMKSENLVSSDFTFMINSGRSERIYEDQQLFKQNLMELQSEEASTHCIYSGVLTSSKEMTGIEHNVALSACDQHRGFTGLITTNEGTYLLQPKSLEQGFSEASLDSSIPHTITLINPNDSGSLACAGVIYGDETENISATEIKTTLPQNVVHNANSPLKSTDKSANIVQNSVSAQHPLNPLKFNKKEMYKKGKKGSGNRRGNRVLELALFADEALVEYQMKNLKTKSLTAIKEFILLLAQGTAIFYHLPSMDTKIDIVVVHIELLKKNPSSLNTNHGLYTQFLSSFCKYAEKLNRKYRKWDHAMLLTGLDIRSDSSSTPLGVAYTTGLCNSRLSCSLIEGKGFMAVPTMAHELGHSIGMDHDGERDNKACANDKYIMAAFSAPNTTSWSSCSNKNMNKFITHLESGDSYYHDKDCLWTRASSGDEDDYSYNSQLPGEKYQAGQQCVMHNKQYPNAVVGSAVKSYGLKGNICEQLYCAKKSWKTATFAHPALEGTECEKGKWCRNGKCVTKT